MEITEYGVAGYPADTNPVSPLREQVEVCKDWIRRWVVPRKTLNRTHDSYYLKHAVEAEAGCCVSNGAFIQAAVELGFRYRRCGYLSPNAWFNMSFDRLRESIRYRCGSAHRRMAFDEFFRQKAAA
jgi:hypothetical protein